MSFTKTLLAVMVGCACGTALPDAPAQADGPKEDVAAKAAALAKGVSEKRPHLTRAELEQRPAVLKKTGGFLDVAPKGTAIVLLEGRAKAGGAADQFAEVFGRLSKYNVRTLRTGLKTVADAVDQAGRALAREKAVFALAVVDDDGGRGLTVYPEERIAVVNAAKYRGGTDPLAPEVRVTKELWRALGFVSGLGYAPFKNDVFQPVFSRAELDALEYQVMQPLNFQKMYNVMSRFGVKRARHIPYRTAVLEGWAPAPTNDYQKAVWTQVKADKERGPTQPLTIVPPKAKK